MLQAHEGVLCTEFSILNEKLQKVVKYGLVFIYK